VEWNAYSTKRLWRTIMAVFPAVEYEAAPAAPEQWALYYNVNDDNLYIQLLPPTSAGVSNIVTPSGAVRASDVVTLTTIAGHGLSVGDTVTVASVSDSTFNGEFIVAAVPTTTSIQYDQVAANSTADGGTITPLYPDGGWQAITTGQEVRDEVRPNDTLTRAKYIGRDYNTHLDEGLTWLRENYADSFNDFVASDFGIILAKYVAAGLDTLSWYMDREVTEWYWPFLRLRARAEYLARMSAYKPTPATACSADLVLTFPDGPYAFDFVVQAKFKVEGPDSLIFEILQNVNVAAGETTKTGVSSIQGRTVEANFVATDEPNQIFDLDELDDDEYIANGSAEVYVNNVLWTVVSFLPFDRLNQVEIMYDSAPPLVVFGNGVTGNIPDEGAAILVRYRVTKGKAGKAATNGTITTPITDLVVNTNVITMEVTNPAVASGGDDPESLESIKATAPAYFKTADRGVTRTDITTLSSSYADAVAGTVAMAKANIVRGISEDVGLQLLLQAVSGLATDLDTYLNAITAQTAIISGSTTDVAGRITTARTEITAAETALTAAEADLGTARTTLENLPYQQLYDRGNGIATVFSVVLDRFPLFTNSVLLWVDDLVETAGGSGTDGDCDTIVGQLIRGSGSFNATWVGRLIKIGTEIRVVTRFIDATHIAYSGTRLTGATLVYAVYDPVAYARDDGNGTLTGSGVSSGTVNYSTGQIDVVFTIAPALDKDVFIQYGYNDSVVTSYLDDASTEIASTETAVGNITSELDDIENTDIAAIDAAVITINGQVTLALTIPADIELALDALEVYLDAHLSDECRANIVSVQALVVDENGFYAAPTQTLLTALATYLETKNVVPTTISTVSGYYYVVAVDMTFNINIIDPYIFSEVKSRLETSIDSLFKGREYDADLYRGDYYNLTVPDQVTGQGGTLGVGYANITIDATSFPDAANAGTPPAVDSSGNLIITDQMVLTKGTISVLEIS
jgi:hypothetical protein